MADHIYPKWLRVLCAFGLVATFVGFMSFVVAVFFFDMGEAAFAAIAVTTGLLCLAAAAHFAKRTPCND